MERKSDNKKAEIYFPYHKLATKLNNIMTKCSVSLRSSTHLFLNLQTRTSVCKILAIMVPDANSFQLKMAAVFDAFAHHSIKAVFAKHVSFTV